MKNTFLKRNKVLVQGILAGIFSVAIASPAWAGLTWENPKNEFTSKIGVDVIHTSYRFTNTGKTPISIVKIQPSCGCVATSLEKFDYAPGESGEIKVTFDLGMDEFAPFQKRTIAVTTSDAPKSPTKLQLRVHVPETVSATPEAVIWHRGEKPKTKDVVVKAGPNVAPIKLIQTTSNDNFVVEVKQEVEGKRYRLKITPVKTDAPSYAELKFNVVSDSFPRRVVCEAHLNVE